MTETRGSSNYALILKRRKASMLMVKRDDNV